MALTRTFLDSARPALDQVVERLEAEFASAGVWDLGRLLLVLPGARAGRRLLEKLVDRAAAAELALIPPAGIVTERGLLERLVPAETKLPSVARPFAWIEAFRRTPEAVHQRVFPRIPPWRDRLRWLSFVRRIDRLARDLAAEGLRFRDVPERAAALPDFDEAPRWLALGELHNRFLEVLTEAGYTDLDDHRLRTLETGAVVPVGWSIRLIGAADLSAVTLRLLECQRDVIACVRADTAFASRFDAAGRVIPAAWAQAEIALDDGRIRQAETVGAEADLVLELLRELAPGRSVDEITIGIGDEEILPWLADRLDRASVPVRFAAGTRVDLTAPIRTLDSLAELLETESFASLTELARQPDVLAWLERPASAAPTVAPDEPPVDDEFTPADRFEPTPSITVRGGARRRSSTTDFLSFLDTFRGRHLPEQVPSWFVGRSEAPHPDYDHPCLKPLARLLDRFAGAPRRLHEWGEPTLGLLDDLFGARTLNPADPDDHRLLEACEKLRDAFLEFQRLARDLDARPEPAEVSSTEAGDTKVSPSGESASGADAEPADAPEPIPADEAVRTPKRPESPLLPKLRAGEAIRIALDAIAGEAITPEPDRSAIEALGWLELALDDAPALIITGMNDGRIPESWSSDPFLPDGLRRVLGLPDSARRYARDAALLTAIVASRPDTRITLRRLTPNQDGLAPSRLLFAADDETLKARVDRLLVQHAAPSAGRVTASARGRPHRFIPSDSMIGSEPPLERLRVTAFRDYLACPFRFYLAHVRRLTPLDDFVNELSPSRFGALLHDVLETFGRDHDARELTHPEPIRDFLLAQLASEIRREWGTEPPAAVALQRWSLEGRLSAFAQWQARWRANGQRIQHVELDIDDPAAALLVDGSRFGLTGRIDRIDVDERSGRWTILDYKTGEARDPDRTHRTKSRWVDLQLPLYRHLVGPLNPPGEPRLGYISLSKSAKDTRDRIAEWSSEDLADADAAAMEVVRRVRQRRFWPPSFETVYSDFTRLMTGADGG
jgi:RecB family exonuclease